MKSTAITPIQVPFTIPLPDGTALPRSVWCYAVRGEVSALIDAGVAQAWPTIKTAVEDGPGSPPLRFLLFTHAHPDHIGAAPSVVRHTRAVTCAHTDSVRWIGDTAAQQRERPVPGFDHLVEGPVRVGRILADGDVVDLGGLTLRALATPGHAEDHLAFHCPEAEALFTGDALPEPGAMPIYTDLAASLASLHRLRTVAPFTTLYSSWEAPIHGEAAIHERFDSAFAWLQRVHDAVREHTPAGEADLASLTAKVMAELGFPPFAANPLTAATVQAHQPFAQYACLTAATKGAIS